MKLFLLTLLASLSLASTDVYPPKEAYNEFVFIATSDYHCNLYIELAGQNLEAMADAESILDTKQLKEALNQFMYNSSKAISICVYIDEQTTAEIVEIQNSISYYYYKNYK